MVQPPAAYSRVSFPAIARVDEGQLGQLAPIAHYHKRHAGRLHGDRSSSQETR
jgi:hypothetical protein